MLLAAYAGSMKLVQTPDPTLQVKVSAGATVRVSASDGLLVVQADGGAGTQTLMFSIEVPLGDAEGFWHPNARHYRTLPADWAGQETLSLVSSTPVGVLYDSAGAAVLGFACDETVDEITKRFGVCEETKTFVVHLELAAKPERSARLAVSTAAAPWTDVLTGLKDWLAAALNIDPMPVPAAALEPVYSTWYTFTQRISAEVIEQEAAIARSIGCASVFIDDGWQLYGDGRGYGGCGDWQPDPAKFPDLAGHVGRLHDLGMAAVLWIAPLLLGEQAQDYPRLAPLAPHHIPRLNTYVLDPRRQEVRDHVVATCVRLMTDYNLDGLKIDFLDRAVVYQGTEAPGDVADVGEAMLILLRQLRNELAAAGFDAPLLEFRQPYVSPSLAEFGNILRAADCPADAIVNRTSIIDSRLLTFGPVVHSDMLMWDPLANPEAAARQLLNVFFSVPQISMRLAALPESHLATLTTVLSQWRAVRSIALDGRLAVGRSSEHYPRIESWDADGNGLIGVYAEQPVPLTPRPGRRVTLLNGTRGDFIVVDLAAAATVRVTSVGADQTSESVNAEIPAGLSKLPAPPCGVVSVDWV
jgi:alpha-galactosidase